MKNGKNKLVLVAGGAGFLGSHLCDALLAEGAHVLALDNFQTGRKQNLRHLEREPRFDVIDADIINPLPSKLRSGRTKIDQVFNLACAASPPHYQANPEHTC
jgi:UDP-glucuronate decarboxylase